MAKVVKVVAALAIAVIASIISTRLIGLHDIYIDNALKELYMILCLNAIAIIAHIFEPPAKRYNRNESKEGEN